MSTELSLERKNEDRGRFSLISCDNVQSREGMETFRRNIPIPFSGLSVNRLRVWSGYNTAVKFVPPCDPLKVCNVLQTSVFCFWR